MLIRVTYVSVWDGGQTIRTPGEYDPETGKAYSLDTVDAPEVESLDREYIELPDESELEVCTTCHEYVLKPIVGDRADQSFGEMQICSNPDCENH